MIVLLTGVPGSGKSYYAVRSVAELLKDKNNVVLSNIEDFRFERFKLYRAYDTKKIINDTVFVSIDTGIYVDISFHLTKLGASFFDYNNMKKYLSQSQFEGKKVYIFIDEAQRYFPKWFKDADIIYFFDYHRHFGLDIYLISQSSSKLCPDIVALSEYELRAVPSSLKFKNMFVYKHLINGEIISRKIIKKDRRIFNLYRSFIVQNDNYSVPGIMYLIPVFFIVGVFFAYMFFSKFVSLAS